VLLFFFSDYFYCGYNKNQCIDSSKLVGTAGVCLGILLFTFAETIASVWGCNSGRGAGKALSDGDRESDDNTELGADHAVPVLELESLRVRKVSEEN
jgi:hypothetical protein